VHDYDSSAYIPLIEENNLYDFVIFHGQKSGKELVKHFNEADFFVLFSNFETQGLVLIESFACGKPVVSTCVGGIPAIVNKDIGVLIDRNDEQALENAINYMLDHHQDYDSAAIRRYAVENFGKDAVREMLFKIYSQILNKR
jgi:glycosyltransferase involved in cell wall biosynthesis